MRKIDYPKGDELLRFEQHYLKKVKPTNVADINCYLSQVKFNDKILTFEILSLLSFEDLMVVKDLLYTYSLGLSTTSENPFNDLFDYGNKQQNIAKFFRSEKSMNFKTCFYCNIDYINSFKDLEDYEDGYDFLNNANINQLQFVIDLGDVKAKRIIKFREAGNEIDRASIENLGLGESLQKRILAIDVNDSHDHFTLDHFLPQSKYPFLSLCLYNLIPSCYSCNSKFKKANTLPEGDWGKVSPSSENFSLDTDFEFRLYYNTSIVLDSVNDFKLKKNILSKDKYIITEYLKMFKIEGRYMQHKDQILNLYKLRLKYPDKKIKEIAEKMKTSKSEIKRLIFGNELFEKARIDEPLIKFKRDMIKKWGIID